MVMTWNNVNAVLPRSPKNPGEIGPNSLVAITAATYSTISSRAAIEPMPGSAPSRAFTTLRMLGTIETRRSTRRTRRARITLKAPLAGSSETPTTTRSNSRHGSRKNRRR